MALLSPTCFSFIFVTFDFGLLPIVFITYLQTRAAFLISWRLSKLNISSTSRGLEKTSWTDIVNLSEKNDTWLGC